jgi:uncharacterized protein YqgC (DUF456 family)
MPILIAAIFIGWYFYKSASNIGKNGLLWVGLALATFVSINVVINIFTRYFGESLLGIDPEDSVIIGAIIGTAAGIFGLFIVNHFLNKIPE